MTGTKVLIGTFCLVCLITLFSIWGAIQWTAEALGYQPAGAWATLVRSAGLALCRSSRSRWLAYAFYRP